MNYFLVNGQEIHILVRGTNHIIHGTLLLLLLYNIIQAHPELSTHFNISNITNKSFKIKIKIKKKKKKKKRERTADRQLWLKT
jgi:hypothetical protein